LTPGAHLGRRIEAGADLDLARYVGDAGDNLVVDIPMREKPPAGAAILPTIKENCTGCPGNCDIEICIRQNDGAISKST
jgi:hypothetical protein